MLIQSLNKLFVSVESGVNINTIINKSIENPKRIYFIKDQNKIIVDGIVYGNDYKIVNSSLSDIINNKSKDSSTFYISEDIGSIWLGNNNLTDRILNISTNIDSSVISYDILTTDGSVNTNNIIFKTINDNNIIGAGNITTIDNLMIPTTYQELKELRDNSQLIPGMKYRLTDYECTTTQFDTSTAGHQFDIIITADDVSILNENCKAIQHDGDTYFQDVNLDAWEIKYTLENDPFVYGWADKNNGKGVIYYMKDEWNNECPYDFKNILFKRYAIANIATINYTDTRFITEYKNTFLYNNINKHFGLKDEYNNLIPTNKIITISNYINNDLRHHIVYNLDENNYEYYYTFNGKYSEDGETILYNYDLSTKPLSIPDEYKQVFIDDSEQYKDMCNNNIINTYTDYYGKTMLNNIVFNTDIAYCYQENNDWSFNFNICYNNIFNGNCYQNTFGNNIYNNTFENDIWNNTFGSYIYNNTFGNNIQNNTFGNYIQNNTFENYIWNNTFGSYIYNNTFGNNIQNNTFENYIQNNTFENYITNNIFGNYIYNNTFGNNIWQNKFLVNIQHNTFGNQIACNIFKGVFLYNVLHNNITYCWFGYESEHNIFGTSLKRLNINCDYFRYNIIENGNTYITLVNSQSTSASQWLQNITIAQGVNNTTTNKTITHNTVNDNFKTIYQSANSQVISI